jgi:hypothetical protein
MAKGTAAARLVLLQDTGAGRGMTLAPGVINTMDLSAVVALLRALKITLIFSRPCRLGQYSGLPVLLPSPRSHFQVSKAELQHHQHPQR